MRPDNDHQTQLAVEVRQVQLDFVFAIAAQLDRSFKQRNRLGGHNCQTCTADLVSTGSRQGRCTLVGVQQPSVIVQKVHAQTTLGVEPFCRIRRVELGQQQDALVDRRNRRIGKLAARTANSLHIQFQFGLRRCDFRRLDLDIKRATGNIHWQISYANGAAWAWARNRIAFCIDCDHDIGPGAPVFIHREINLATALGQCDELLVDDRLIGDNNLRLSGIGGHQCQACFLADFNRTFRRGYPHLIGRLSPRLCAAAPACPELVTGFNASAAILQAELIVAPVQFPRNQFERGLAIQRGKTLIHIDNIAGPAPFPLTAIRAVPVIVPVDPDQRPIHLRRAHFPHGRHRHSLETSLSAFFGRTVKFWLYTQIGILCAIRNTDIITDRTTAGFNSCQNCTQAQWFRTGDPFAARIQIYNGISRAISHRCIHRDLAFSEALVELAECVIRKGRIWIRLNLDTCARLNIKPSARRPVKKSDICADAARFIVQNGRLIIAFNHQLNSLGHKVFDRNARFTHGPNAVDTHNSAPLTASRLLRQFIDHRHSPSIACTIKPARHRL